jgi:hypothetical protein
MGPKTKNYSLKRSEWLMRGDIENGMVVDGYWKHREQEPKVYGECAGCGEDIYAGEDYYEIRSSNDVLMVHQKSDCCMDFVAEMAFCRTAGEE